MSDTKYVTRVLRGPEAEISRRMMEVIELQAGIVQRYTQHTRQCESLRMMIAEDCTCGLSAALAALRKLQDGG